MPKETLRCIRRAKGYEFMELLTMIILMCVKQLPAVLHEITPILKAILDYLRKRR